MKTNLTSIIGSVAACLALLGSACMAGTPITTLTVDTTFADDTVTAGTSGHTFTITVANNGGVDAHNLTVSNVVPASLNVTSVSANVGTVSESPANTITGSLPTLTPGASWIISVTYSVPSTVNSSTIINTAFAASNESGQVSDNDSVNVIEDVSLSITKDFSNPGNDGAGDTPEETVTAGGASQTFFITVANTGISTADNVHITDTVDSRLIVDSVGASPALGADQVPGAQGIDWLISSLAAGQSVSLTVTYHVASETGSALVNNTASADSDEVTPFNDSDDVQITVPPCSIFVDTTADSGFGSLRDALACALDGDTITFDTNGVFATPQTILLTNGQLFVNNSVTIFGPGATNLSVNGNYPVTTNRGFNISSNLVVTIAGLTITGGTANKGGGINNNHSILTVSNCTVTGNSSSDSGGGIYNDGETSGSATLWVINSTLTGNHGGVSGGGGIRNNGQIGGNATTWVIASTLSGNLSDASGGGCANSGADGHAFLTVINSTISSNSAVNRAGGIINLGDEGVVTLSVIASTFSGNSSGQPGGGIYSDGLDGTTTVHIASTILNAGASGGSIAHDFGTVTSLGYNLSSDGGGGVLTQSTDQINTDPQLGPLQDNGGPTFSHSLLCGSPAIDAGTNFLALATDQRGDGFPRTFGTANVSGGDGTDIGAYELQQTCAEDQLTALSPALVWIGLKTSDDIGTKFDLLAEVLKNGTVIASNQLSNVKPGGGSAFAKAVLKTINQTLPNSVVLSSGDELEFRLSVRIAVGVSGHRSGTARLWYNDAQANSHFGATIDGDTTDLYLLDGFVLDTSAGAGPKKSIDVTVDRAKNGNPFKPFGTWSITN